MKPIFRIAPVSHPHVLTINPHLIFNTAFLKDCADSLHILTFLLSSFEYEMELSLTKQRVVQCL